MATQLSPPRPDLDAHRRSVSESFPEVTQHLIEILGRKLTAYVGSLTDVRGLDRWIVGNASYGTDTEQRVRLAYRIAKMLFDGNESGNVIQSWFTGLNPELEDRVPIRLLREGDLEQDGKEVLRAARAFLAGG